MTTTDQLPPDLATFRDSYVKLFGSMPPPDGPNRLPNFGYISANLASHANGE